MLPNAATAAHYALLSAMLAPAFFLTATASLLLSANNRLSRIIDRARMLLRELQELPAGEAVDRALVEQRIALQRRRSMIILRASLLLYVAITFFVGTSLMVAADGFFGYRFGLVPTGLAAMGVLSLFASSLLLALESTMAVKAINEEMDHRHLRARQ